MITLLQNGLYKLIETKHQNKVLYLDDDVYAWVEPKDIGEILITSRKVHKTDCVLAVGEYRLYGVEDEPALSDLTHLELEVGKGAWQGYLLLTGLPNELKARARIIPTREVITKNPRYNRRKDLRVNKGALHRQAGA